MAVQLVIVSHSARLAEGVIELASQMAPKVGFHAAGGRDDGGIGTSFTKVLNAVEQIVDAGDNAALLTDLGSATMTAESVLDFVTDAARVALAEGPLVEGAVAAAVVADSGGDLKAVIAAVADAATSLQSAELGVPAAPGAPGSAAAADAPGTATATAGASSAGASPATSASAASTTADAPAAEVHAADLVLRNDVGLHARPAAALSRLAASFDATITVNDKPASSVLSLMSLGLGQGATIHLKASGADAKAAVAAITQLVEANFAESKADS
ncbi:hypothetical protein BSZ39_09650 [Bowdeniella nasicola]|uniref:Phosphocarrier protein HPr n=1 Tax=Bowdeniella nasicola TaxID=208480 RepID=A0A1Q5Q0U3_9ACTO|nr:dihydroxyacetone kinase phosphoryl donor subunit DhaM [Bowdeniella nasicola]OKL53407.1 hypothetical protein BSZ39_09650 [Bowdeniella nasicola]